MFLKSKPMQKYSAKFNFRGNVFAHTRIRFNFLGNKTVCFNIAFLLIVTWKL